MISKLKRIIIVALKKAYWISLSFFKRAQKKFRSIKLIISRLPKTHPLDFNFGIRANAILLVSSGRSGSTWIAALINHTNEYRLLFEPFHPEYCEYMEFFPDLLYLAEGEDFNQKQTQILDNVIMGKVQTKWVNKFNNRLVSNNRMIKSIRAQFILNKLWEKYRLPIIYLMRHPLAVVSSILIYSKSDQTWDPDLEPVVNNKHFMDQLNEEQQTLIVTASTDFQKLLALWCLDNFFSLRQLSSIPHHLVFYENVYDNPVLEMQNIFSFLAKPFGKRNVKLIDGQAKIRYIDIENSEKSSLNKWQDIFNEREKQQAEVYLREFSLDKYYTINSSFPAKEHLG